MEFTYNGYLELINLLKDKSYNFCGYLDYGNYKKNVIFRHDVDTSLEKALEIAKLEFNNYVKSTFFVLLSTNFYNIFSKESNTILKEIMALGHDIGLHFDEKRYDIYNAKELEYWVNRESDILAYALDKKVKVVSMHRPSKWVLENDIQFKKMVNSYSKKFFSDFKYLSDSRMHWREDVLRVIESESYNRLHILTHPFWYSKANETIGKKLIGFITEAKKDRHCYLKDNIKDLDELIDEGELFYGY
jgi:hypothetical protein